MKLSDYIAEFLIEKGITEVFGYPGGMVTHLMDSFDRYGDRLHAHVNYHEQGAAFAACGYAQVSGRPGMAYATSGPGATNLITGICNAYFDSVPAIFVTGQVNTYESKGTLGVRQKGFQETDILGMVGGCTKYAVQVTDAERIRYELEKAYHAAMSGRRGPVLLDIPMNILRADINPAALEGFPAEPPTPVPDVSAIIHALGEAKRPVLLVGGGVRLADATRELRELTARLHIPVVTSMVAVDALPSDAPCYYGMIGAYGSRAANMIVAKSDLLITLGSRLDIRQTGAQKQNFVPKGRIIRVDVDAGEMTNVAKPEECQIQADVGAVITALLADNTPLPDCAAWRQVCDTVRGRLAGRDDRLPNQMIRAISAAVPENAVITTDVGQNQVWVAQSFAVKAEQRVLFSGGHGAMGYSLPAAIGACYAARCPVFCFTGDGGFQMNVQELQFVAREHLPMKIIVCNNQALGMIRHFQEMYFDGRYVQTIGDGGYTVPNLQKLAAAYELGYRRVETPEQAAALTLTDSVPELIELAMPYETYVFPKLAMGKPGYDQDPLLDRAEYEEIMAL